MCKTSHGYLYVRQPVCETGREYLYVNETDCVSCLLISTASLTHGYLRPVLHTDIQHTNIHDHSHSDGYLRHISLTGVYRVFCLLISTASLPLGYPRPVLHTDINGQSQFWITMASLTNEYQRPVLHTNIYGFLTFGYPRPVSLSDIPANISKRDMPSISVCRTGHDYLNVRLVVDIRV